MHRLATVHARDNQPTNNQRCHDTAYLNKRRLKTSKLYMVDYKYTQNFKCFTFLKFPVWAGS